MTSDWWTRRGCRDCSPSRRASCDNCRRRGYGVDIDNAYKYKSAYEDCMALSPNTSLRKIAALENRITELTSSSESLTRRLGLAERTLRDIDINDADDIGAAVNRRRSPTDDVSDDDDDELAVCRRGHHHSQTHREELRREIARLRDDVHVLRRSLSASRGLDRFSGRSHADDLLDYDCYDDAELTDWGRRQLLYQSQPLAEHIGRRSRCTSPESVRYRASSSTCCNGTGQRSILHRPKYGLHSPTARHRKFYHTFDVSAKRAYRPHVPGDLNTGDVVKFRRPGGRIEVGQVHYVGHLPGKSQAFVGLETQHATGNHDGTLGGFRYFQCKPNRGLFVPFDHVVMAWGSF